MQAILFSPGFQAPEELDIYAKTLGYANSNYRHDFKLMFDERIIDFCKERSQFVLGRWKYLGRLNKAFLTGHAGFAVFEDIDINRKWTIDYDNSRIPVVRYVFVRTNEYNYVQLRGW